MALQNTLHRQQTTQELCTEAKRTGQGDGAKLQAEQVGGAFLKGFSQGCELFSSVGLIVLDLSQNLSLLF
jgi:hypothetical protein